MDDSDSDTISSDGSELYELDHSEDPMRLRIPINPSSPESWTDIATRIRPHLRCSVPCLERLREKRTFVQSVRYQELVCDAADRRTEAREEEARRTLHPVQYQFPLLSLPSEIFLKIFDAMSGSYTLRAYLCLAASDTNPDRGQTHIIFSDPRMWASMKIFHVSRLFRSLAIHKYGTPSPDALPFCPLVDSLEVLHSNTYGARRGFGRYYESVLETVSRATDGDERWHSTDLISRYTTPLVDDYEYDYDRINLKFLRGQFLERISHVHLYGLEPGELDGERWGKLLSTFSALLPSIRYLRILLYQYDGCGNRDRPSPKYKYREADLFLLEGLSRSDTQVYSDNPRRLFPFLECLDLTWLAEFCSEQYFPDGFEDYTGERIVGEGVLEDQGGDDEDEDDEDEDDEDEDEDDELQ
ncbi:hypothetical protein F5Y04DRAFT_285397 [Hypomontagnella monticulosa]|nr:hypothetical protein F5Y04DRAFT_285397 [Hypomontagnella monticulosa]